MLRNITSSVLILMFVALSINRVSNWHTHVSTDGVVFQHAHPYSKTGDSEKHSHSEGELSVLVLINDAFDDEIQSAYIPSALVSPAKDFQVYRELYKFVSDRQFKNKSPPYYL